MSVLLWLVVLLPFVGFATLSLLGRSLPKRVSGVIGCTSVGLSWVCAMVVGASFLSGRPAVGINAPLFPWIDTGTLSIAMGLHLDALSLVMMSVVTFVAFLIHLYSSQSMYEEDGYNRFFSYMNLFVASMLVLVLADNLVLLYLGWEGVGLCSYLLIGFWYRDLNNGLAAQKAFIVTRVGDTALALGLFLLFRELGTLNTQEILARAPSELAAGGALVTTLAFLILGGAVGKSAQVPLQVWLPDAMAGPTPVSALIHAATMVTAGVYLIARLHVLFLMAPAALLAVAIVGTITLFYSGFTALVQSDVKRVLAYSTISQIGYMFLGLGVGAWAPAVFHFMTHAFFKALLFLSAGAASDALHHELNMFRMGGLWGRVRVAPWAFLIGGLALSAVPPTSGFWSKDAILLASAASPYGSPWFLALGLIAALMTATYTFRAFFLTFLGQPHGEVSKQPGSLMNLAMIVLSFFALVAGFLERPFEHLVSPVFMATPVAEVPAGATSALPLQVTSLVLAAVGAALAWLYFTRPAWSEAVGRSPIGRELHRFFFTGWAFDWLYQTVLVRPLKAIIIADRNDVVDSVFNGLGEVGRYANATLSATQTGRLRGYAAGVVLGAVIVAAIALLRG